MQVVEMVRYEVGEGIEKKEENFAEEVAKQMGQQLYTSIDHDFKPLWAPVYQALKGAFSIAGIFIIPICACGDKML